MKDCGNRVQMHLNRIAEFRWNHWNARFILKTT